MKYKFWLHGFYHTHKLLISILIGILLPPIFNFDKNDTLLRLICGWDIFAFTYLSFYWISFYRTPISLIRKEAEREDNNRGILFLLVLLCIFASMIAIILLLNSQHQNDQNKIQNLLAATIGMIFSWSLLHTIFAVRYAHLYYNAKDGKIGGLDFPGEEKPDFLDFAYFSFVLGMTFQVSDISITDRKVRHIVLTQSLISFAYNAVIIAMTINIIAGITQN